MENSQVSNNINNISRITVENIMDKTFDERSNVIRALFKKTVYVKQYETEVVELETSITVDNSISSWERMYISAMLQLQLEYSAYCQLYFKKFITDTEFVSRVKELEDGMNALKSKIESVIGKTVNFPLGNIV